MSVPKTTTTPWHDPLEKAVRLLPADPDALLFHEERENARIEVDGRDPFARISLSRIRGAAARDGAGKIHHRSNPSPEDLAALAAGLHDGGGPPLQSGPRLADSGDYATRLPETERVARALVQASTRIRTLGAGVIADLSIDWVAFVQRIWVAPASGLARQDVRRGCRMRVTAGANGWPRGVTVAVDRVVKPDTLPSVDGRIEPLVGSLVEPLIEPMIQRLRQRLTARRAPAGNHPIVFAPGTGGVVLHELVGHALEADTVARGGSLLAGTRGTVSSELVTVIDDPRRGRAAWRVDDDGCDSTPVALMREGRVTGLMHDERSARGKKRSSTGHGRCSSYSAAVRPRMGCTFLAAGPHDPREVIESTRAGVYIRRMESAGTDPAIGVAHFRVTDADRIEGGRLDAPLEPFVLRVTVADGLASIDCVADDVEFDTCIGSCVRDGQTLATSVGAPTYRLGVATINS